MDLDNIILLDCEERMEKSINSFVEALNRVWDLYSTDAKIIETVKINLTV